jgi:LPXTG-motif cell wall-anchored protein
MTGFGAMLNWPALAGALSLALSILLWLDKQR